MFLKTDSSGIERNNWAKYCLRRILMSRFLHLILFLMAKLDIALEWIAQSRYKVSIQWMINRCWRVIPLGQHWVLLGLLDFLVGLFFFQGNSIALYFLSLNFVFLVRPLNVRSITSMTFWVHNTSVLSIDTMFHCGSSLTKTSSHQLMSSSPSLWILADVNLTVLFTCC